MTLATMIYGLVVAGLVGAAAWCFDRGLRALGRPTRWVWLSALGIGAMAPFFPRFLPSGASGGGSGPFALPVQVLYELGTPAAPLPEQSGGLLAGIGVENSVGALWIGGSVLVVTLFALISLRLRRLRATWEPRNVCGEEVLRSDRFGPAVVGLIRSRIVLPSWSFGLGENELDMIVLHEREHVRARDPALLAAGLLLAALSPWNPAVWWSLVRLRLAVEGDCDRRVLARGASARSYARLLLTVATGCRGTPEPVPTLVRGGRSVMERRLMMIKTATRKPRIRASLLTAAAGLGLFALACDTPVPQGPAELQHPTRSQAVIVPEAVIEPEVGAGVEAPVGYGEVGLVDVVGSYQKVYVTVEEDGSFRVTGDVDLTGAREDAGLYVDEDGILRAVDAEVAARIRRTLEQAVITREKLEERLRAVDITKERVPEDLWLRLGNVGQRLGELLSGSEEMVTELTMEVRRLHAAVEAGEITHDEAKRMLQTHMGARDARLRWPDKPH